MTTAIEKVFFTPLYYPRSDWDVVKWWEARRPVYNAVIGATGLITLGTVAALHPGPPLMFAAFAVGFGILANVCYTMGPVVDIAVRRFMKEEAPSVGPVLFRYGFAFSLGLTLLPIPMAVIGKLLQWLF